MVTSGALKELNNNPGYYENLIKQINDEYKSFPHEEQINKVTIYVFLIKKGFV